MFLRPDELVPTATCRAYCGVSEDTGEVITASELAKRVGWAVVLTDRLGHAMLEENYTCDGLKTLVVGAGTDGRRLPSKGYMAGRRLGWSCSPAPVGLYLPDRFCRAVEEQVLRRLRQAAWLSGVIDALLASWPESPKSALLRSGMPLMTPCPMLWTR